MMSEPTQRNQSAMQQVKPDQQSVVFGNKLMWFCTVAIAVLAAGLIWWFTHLSIANAASTSDQQMVDLESTRMNDSLTGADRVVATVDGIEVSQLEIADQLRSGIDKAIVVDRYINKVIAAQLGQKLYPEVAKAALRAAEREVLATVYTTRRLQEIREQVTDKEVKEYYDKNVLDENFKQWKVSYYLTNDPQDIQKTSVRLKEGDKKALDQLTPLRTDGDGFLAAQSMPYGLGRVVNSLKKGQFSEILNLRNGFMVVRIDDMKQLDKPTLEDLKSQIIDSIVLRKFNSELEKFRSAAKIELG